MKCARTGCGRTAAPPADLCEPCAIELYYKIMALSCAVCGNPYPHDEARVVRQLRNPDAKLDHFTPLLCWICARLHHSAAVPEPPRLDWI